MEELKNEFNKLFVLATLDNDLSDQQKFDKLWQWIAQHLLTSDLHKGIFRGLTQEMISLVPQTYGEAIQKFPFINCLNHEWDNRTTIENAFYLVEQFNKHLLAQYLPKQEKKEDFTEQEILQFGDKILTELKKDPNFITSKLNRDEEISFNTGFHKGFSKGWHHYKFIVESKI